MTRKGIDVCVLAIDLKEPENTQIFSSEVALQKYMEREGLIFKRAEVEDCGTVEIRERMIQKLEVASEEFQEDWVIHYSQKVFKKTDF